MTKTAIAVHLHRRRIYLVEPAGPFEDDPNLTDKRFPGNPTQSYRSREPLRVVGEVTGWQPHSAEQLQQMKDSLARLKAEGRDVIIDRHNEAAGDYLRPHIQNATRVLLGQAHAAQLVPQMNRNLSIVGPIAPGCSTGTRKSGARLHQRQGNGRCG